MLFKAKKVRPLALVCCFLCTLFSCSENREVFKNLLQNNIIWSDQEGRITIFVQGPSVKYGFAIIESGEEKKTAEALFETAQPMPAGITLNIQNNNSLKPLLSLEFVKSENEGSVVLETSYDFSKGIMLNHSYEILLTKRPIKSDEYDVRHCIHTYWLSDDQSLYLYQDDMSPFTGQAKGRYNNESVLFSFLNGNAFKLEKDGNLLGSGKYESPLNGMDLIFEDDIGKATFGERIHLGWAYGNGEPNPWTPDTTK